MQATGKQRAAHDGVSIYLVNLLPKAVHVRCEPECKQYSRVDFFIFCIRGGAIKQTSKVGQIRHVNSDGYFVKRNAQCDPQTAKSFGSARNLSAAYRLAKMRH